MTSSIVLQELDIKSKWTLPENLQADYVSSKSSLIPGVRVILAPFANAAREIGIPNTFTKIAKNISQYFVTLNADASAKNLVNACNTFGDIVKVASFPKGVDDILSNAAKQDETGINLHQRNLGIASGFFQTIISGMAGVKLLNTFQAISIADISLALGTTTVLPFSVVTNGVEIVKNVVDITSKSLNIHETNIQDNKAKAKMKNFRTDKKTDNAKIKAFLEAHIQEMEAKQAKAIEKLNNQTDLQAKAAAAAKATDNCQADIDEGIELDKPETNKIRKTLGKICLFFKEISHKSTLFAATDAYMKAYDAHIETTRKFDARVIKLDDWKALQKHFKDHHEKLVLDSNNKIDNTDPLNQLIAAKSTRWAAIRKNCGLANTKDGIGIAISVVATIGLIATIVLTFTGVGTIPVLLTMTSLWLILALAGLGSTLYSKYKKPVDIPTVNLNTYAAAAAAAA